MFTPLIAPFMKLIISQVIFFLLVIISANAQTFQGSAGPIKDDGTISDFVVDVQGLSPDSLTPAFGLKSVCINLVHTWVSDLDIRLIAPDGHNILLASGLGGDGDAYMNTCFEMDAPTHIINSWWPFTGSFIPFSNLGNANNGQDGNGHWILRILDTYAYADEGTLLDWQLTFGEQAPAPDVFGSSSLPICIINTDQNYTIPDNPKIPGTLKVIDNGAGQLNHLTDTPSQEMNLAIEVRGSSSQSFPKKSYGFETKDDIGDDLEIDLLGLPKDEDWIFYAPYTDKSFLRDALTYKLGNDMGRYAPRTRFCELFLNGDYQGVYCLEEKIKRDKNRVDISKLKETDIDGDSLTGGYILKVDRDSGPESYFVSDFEGTDTTGEIRIVYEDPKGPDMQPEQRAYIQGFYHAFEHALYSDDFKDEQLGYRRYMDVPSWIDNFLVTELGHNVDGYRLSTFMYKDRDSKDSLLHLGPLWDFNLAYGNVDYCSCENIAGWTYNDSGGCGNTPTWWPRLLEDPYFQDELKCRYKELRETVLSTDHILHYLDSMAVTFNQIEERNYAKWPILGIYIWPNHFIGTSYQEEIYYMEDWITQRLDWMDENMPGICFPVAVEEPTNQALSIYPNPATQSITLQFPESKSSLDRVTITNLSGIQFLSQQVNGNQSILDISQLPPGIYVATLITADNKTYHQKVVVAR